MELVKWIAAIVGGFLLGGVMFSKIIPRIFAKKDVCALHEDHNPGAANVFMSCGVFLGMVCLLLDMAKGFLPVFLSALYLDSQNMLFTAVVAAPVLGHAAGVFNRFHGGKCIATSFGVVLGLVPLTQIGWILVALYIFFSVAVRITPHRRRSLITFVLFGAASFLILLLQEKYAIALGCLVFSAVAALKHTRRFSPDEAPRVGKTPQEDETPAPAMNDDESIAVSDGEQ